jgi:serine/threonine-protein kinase
MAADAHLLFGLIALQNGLIQQSQLVAAFHAWSCDKSRSLADQLVRQGDLDADDRAAVEALVARHKKRHGDDLEQSLAALPAGKPIRESLAGLGDPDIRATLGHVASGHGSTHDDDAERTAAYSIGTATSDGQRFRVLRPHARGALGAVFVALDNELHREVALKQIVDRHADDPVSRQRFLIEAEITGGLEHPGIVPVYGLGSYADGRPYYAMRFIRGDSLREAIDRFHADAAQRTEPGMRSLALRKLLRRFTDVCNAIEYAHSRGVLHRDIKPGNVIVGKHGETLVVDWGLAKPFGHVEPGHNLGERTLVPSSASGSAETLPGSTLGTPAYMSPEQASGELDRLGPRSDVYSLGATLYCLLTGMPPFEGEVGEVVREVQQGEFAHPRALDPSIDRALEAVCLKAMATNALDRYASCRALADDVERWAADEPVAAWPEPLGRRARRWGRRHRTAMTGAAAALLAGFVGLAAVLVVQTEAKGRLSRANTQLVASLVREARANQGLAEANSALGDANAELTKSKSAVQARYDLAVEAIKTFHTGVSEDFLLREEAFKHLRDRLLRSASDFYGRLGSLLGKESDLASRRALGQAEFEVAELTEKVGRKQDALEAHRRVLVFREAMAAESGSDAQTQVDVGRSLTAVASLLESIGKPDEAVAAYRKAEALLGDLVRDQPLSAVASAQAALASCRAELGLLLALTGQNDEALKRLRAARAELESTTKGHATPEALERLATVIYRIGWLSRNTGRPAEALKDYRAALAIRKDLADRNPGIPNYRAGVAESRASINEVLAETGHWDEAIGELRRSVAIYQDLARAYPGVTRFQSDLAGSHSSIGQLLSDTGKSDQAMAEYHRALAIRKELMEDHPGIPAFRHDLAHTQISIANLLQSRGRTAEALERYRAAQQIFQGLADSSPSVSHYRADLAFSHYWIGGLLPSTNRLPEALDESRRAVALYHRLAADNPSITHYRGGLAGNHGNIGWILSQMGRTEDAMAEYREALTIHQKLAADNPALTGRRRTLAWNHHAIGNLLRDAGRPAEALEHYRPAIDIMQELVQQNPSLMDFRDTAAEYGSDAVAALLRLGRTTEARGLIDRSVPRLEELVAAEPSNVEYREDLVESLLRRGQVLRAQGEPARASADWRRASALYGAAEAPKASARLLLACCHAGLSALAGVQGSGVRADQGSLEAGRAMELLRRAVAEGLRDRGRLGNEAALDPLRARIDFQLLLLDVGMPIDPFARAR